MKSRTLNDIMNRVKRENRLEEIEKFGKLISMRTHIKQSKKKYKRNKRIKIEDYGE